MEAMNCLEAQEKILENLDGALTATDQAHLQHHLSRCDACTRFAEVQRAVDHKLAESLRPPALTGDFGPGVRRAIQPHRHNAWVGWLPDVAYIAGAGAALVLCAALLPMPASALLLGGGLIAIVAYAVEIALVGALEEASE